MPYGGMLQVMKAAIVRAYGSEVEVTDIEKPVLLPDSVMIEVRAASVNPVDNAIRAGYMKDMVALPLPYTVGNDVSGVVTEIGDDVTLFKVGDEVFARPRTTQSGTFAEFVMVNEADVARKPANVSHEEAASLPLVALTALQALVSKANVRSGQKVLIHSGAGGVGSVAVQIAKHLGATVATTAGADDKDMVRALGADIVIDYRNEKFEDVIADYDVVIDTMGGATQERSYAVLKEGGLLVSILMPTKATELAKQRGIKSEFFLMWPSHEQLTQISQWVEAGVVKPRVGRTYPLDQAQEALDDIQSHRTKGKIVITV